MKVKIFAPVLAAALSFLMVTPPARAAYEFHARIKGSKQGVFKGVAGREGDQIPAVAFRMVSDAPRDIQTGQASGHREQSSVVITKEWGPSSPQLLQAAATNELLTQVELIFPSENDSRSTTPENSAERTLILHDAMITDLREFGQPGGEMEDVSFTFHSMEWKGGASSTADGRGGLTLEITGPQGPIKTAGGATSVPALGFHYEAESPRDVVTGAATGAIRHTPFEVKLPGGALTQALNQAIASNQKLDSVVVRSVKEGAAGKAEQAYQVELRNATVSKLAQDTDASGQVDNVEFTYQKIEYDFGDAATAGGRSATARAGDITISPFETTSQAKGALAPAFYLSIKGSHQGQFKGEARGPEGDNQIGGLAFSYEIASPRDATTGQATGRRSSKPITVLKEWGPGTPQILEALDTNETLPLVVFDFVKRSAGGELQIYQKITLHDAVISRVVEDVNASERTENVSFVFRSMDMTNPSSGITTAVDWAPGARF